jgi:hypothetical protein
VVVRRAFGHGASQEHPCVRPQEPFVIALCSDPELRALADQRPAAMVATWSRLSPEDQRRFRSEQLAWRETTARTCGVASSPPPLSVAVKDCLKRAEIARTEFLRHYTTMGTGSVAMPEAPAQLPVAPVPAIEPAGESRSGNVPMWNVILFLAFIITQLWVSRRWIKRLFFYSTAFRNTRNPLLLIGAVVFIDMILWIAFWRWVGVIT